MHPIRLPVLLLLLLVIPRPSLLEAAKPPNIIFLFADDQRADTIAAWGNAHIQTPHLDSLVRRGFSFRNNYNLGSNSGAVCVPSRSMVHTGKAYFRVPNDMGKATLLPAWLEEQGYTTFATGKWHNGPASWLRAFRQGKAIFFGGMSDHTKVPLQDLLPGHVLGNQREAGFSSTIFADAAVDFLRTYSDQKPFYLYVAFTVPHDPRQPPEAYRQGYYRNYPPLPANFMPQHPFDNGELTHRDENLAAWPRTEAVIRDQLAEYYGLISHMDEQIGRILAALEATGRLENTVVIYAADHGLALGSHGLLGKQNLYEHSAKSPLIFAGPGIPHGSTEDFTYLLDIFPTVAGLAGLTPPGDLDGHDLAPLWRGEKTQLRESIFLSFTDTMRAVRDARHKLIYYPQVNFRQLFDLLADPDEMHNLAEKPEHADDLHRLTAVLKLWQEKLGDDQPLRTENPKPLKVDLTGRERRPDRWQPEWIVEKYFD